MTNPKRKFLANLVADLGKLAIGAGAVSQIFSAAPDWFIVARTVAGSLILFVIAFSIYPSWED